MKSYWVCTSKTDVQAYIVKSTVAIFILLQCHMHLSTSKINNSPYKLCVSDYHVGG